MLTIKFITIFQLLTAASKLSNSCKMSFQGPWEMYVVICKARRREKPAITNWSTSRSLSDFAIFETTVTVKLVKLSEWMECVLLT